MSNIPFDDEEEEFESVFDLDSYDSTNSPDNYCTECDESLGEDDAGNIICTNEECPKFMIPVITEG